MPQWPSWHLSLAGRWEPQHEPEFNIRDTRRATAVARPTIDVDNRPKTRRPDRSGSPWDIWERPGLSKRDHSLVTISALIALGRSDQLRSHLNLGLQNGLTKDEIAEAITHMALYSGWPSAVSAVTVAREVFDAQ